MLTTTRRKISTVNKKTAAVATEDSELFRQAVGDGLRPLRNDRVPLATHEKSRPFPKAKPAMEQPAAPIAYDPDLPPVGLEDPLSYLKPGLAKNTLKKLRQGFFGLDAELDLHGLTSPEALRQLLDFLQCSHVRQRRCVRIIHGKGHHSATRQPVIKNNINQWLRQHEQVLAFCSPPPREGGAGAVFVLLRETGPR